MVVWRHHHRLSDRVLRRHSLVLVSVLRSHSLVLARVLLVLRRHLLVLQRLLALVNSAGIVVLYVARSVARHARHLNIYYGLVVDNVVVLVLVFIGDYDLWSGSINVDYVYCVLFKAAPLATSTYADKDATYDAKRHYQADYSITCRHF